MLREARYTSRTRPIYERSFFIPASDNKPAANSKGPGHGGPARGYSWPPFPPGNKLSRRHGLYSKFAMLEGKEEITETAELLRSVLPVYASAFEVALQLLAARLWRLRRGYEFVEKTPEGEIPAKFLESLNALENLVGRSLARLGLDPIAASELGINLSLWRPAAKTARPRSAGTSSIPRSAARSSGFSRKAGEPMASERDIQDAERAKLEAIVAAHGSEAERFQLVLSGVMRNGITLGQLEGVEPPVGYLPLEPEFLARLSRRAERRAKLGLPAVECAGDPPTRHGCSCLERALDEPGDVSGGKASASTAAKRPDGGKRHVLKRAAALHWSPPRRTEPARPVEEPTPARPEAEQEAPAAKGPPPKPAEAAPPVRVVHRVRRWYDDSERPRFGDTKF